MVKLESFISGTLTDDITVTVETKRGVIGNLALIVWLWPELNTKIPGTFRPLLEIAGS